MAVKSRDNVFDKPFKMLDLLRNAKWENSFLSKIALFTHSLKKVIPTFKEILSVSKTKNWCLLQNIIPTFLLKTFEFISFIIKGRDNKKVGITTKVSPTTYNTQKTVLPNFYKRKTLQSSKDYNASQTVFSCALDVYSSPVSTFLISFAVAVIICNPVSLIPSSSVSSCLRCVDLLATLSGKKN